MSQGRVVVIDDDREVCELVARALRRAGWDVKTALDGPHGLELMADEEVACLVVDKILPGPNGLEVMAEVRNRWPGLPVVLMTGHPEPFQLGEARPDVVLTKPFPGIKVVVDAVASAVDAARPARAEGALSQLRERVVAVVSELAPGLKKRE